MFIPCDLDDKCGLKCWLIKTRKSRSCCQRFKLSCCKVPKNKCKFNTIVIDCLLDRAPCQVLGVWRQIQFQTLKGPQLIKRDKSLEWHLQAGFKSYPNNGSTLGASIAIKQILLELKTLWRNHYKVWIGPWTPKIPDKVQKGKKTLEKEGSIRGKGSMCL